MRRGIRKKTWGTIIDTIIKRKLHSKIALIENDCTINETVIPNKFCKYFTTIADKMVSNIPVGQTNPVSYLKIEL